MTELGDRANIEALIYPRSLRTGNLGWVAASGVHELTQLAFGLLFPIFSSARQRAQLTLKVRRTVPTGEWTWLSARPF
jgi:hypothetical protein